jgi:alpha-D-ribose 1-methylphosphonate 5-triphosphate synthase subunit PhnG
MDRKLEPKLDIARKAAMAAFASTSASALRELAEAADLPLEAELLRGPETGLVTVRGRIGGGGAPFNTGEATVTRATVRLPSGQVGHAYALGRDKEKVRLAAILDASWCVEETRATVEEKIVAPLQRLRAEADGKRRAETAATKVDFFTMVRGED